MPNVRVLIVCTGNVCRSPYLERLLAAQLPDVQVASAGTGALVGEPMQPGSLARLEQRGIFAVDFRARQLTEQIANDADLVLTATREHRAAVVQTAPRMLKRTFAAADFAALTSGFDTLPPARASFFGEPDPSYAGRLASGIERVRGSVTLPDDPDITDPFMRDDAVYDLMAQQVDAILPGLIHGLTLGA